MSLGSNISRLRAKHGLSQDALAERLGVSRQSISKWETDASVPELDKLIKLAELFSITLDELVTGAAPSAPQSGEPPLPPTGTPQLDADRPAPQLAPAATAVGVTRHQLAGLVMIILGGLLLVMLSLVGGFLEGLVLGTPFFVSGLVLFGCRRRAGLWCAWLWLMMAELYLDFVTGTRWNLILTLFSYPNIWRNMPAQVIISAVLSAARLALIFATLRSYRTLRLPLTRRFLLPSLAGLALIVAARCGYVGVYGWYFVHFKDRMWLEYPLRILFALFTVFDFAGFTWLLVRAVAHWRAVREK